jgi:hypothetical protein
MDASTLINRRRNQTLYTWLNNKSAEKREQTNEKSNLVYIQRIQGCPYQCDPCVPSDYTLDEAVIMALEALLIDGAGQNLGPTKCSRINYMWFLALASGYNWISGAGTIPGVKDGWDWTVHHPLTTDRSVFMFMNHLLIDIMPIFVPGYYTGTLLLKEREAFDMSPEEQATQWASVRIAGNYAGWRATWDIWYGNRQSDGSVAAASYVPTAAPDLPNGTTTLTAWNTAQDPATFADPTKWTPLQLTNGGPRKNYYTWNWHDVATTCVSPVEDATIIAAADAHFLTDPDDRRADLRAMLDITDNLKANEDKKMLAEFWAAGPYTISPPGMFIWFWKEYMLATKKAHTQGLNSFFYSGLDLAIHLFEAGRMVWGVKKNHMEARPIQEIRNLFRAVYITQYDAIIPIMGQFWKPYQAPNFVTPPFADFPSGHSAFSQSFASVMTEWFGPDIPTVTTTRTDQQLLSPNLPTTATEQFCRFTFAPGSSGVEPGIVPTAPLTIGTTWTEWQDMADSAGISRQYGGIHANSAHLGSKALATALHAVINTNWGIQK